MIALTIAETQRLILRRMTQFFPLALAALMVIGIVIAAIVVQSNDEGGVDFVADILTSDESFAANELGAERGTEIFGPLGFLIPIMGFVIGASYWGADEKAGMIEHLLTWEPRRARLILARMGGGAATIFLISALLSLIFVLLLYGLSVFTDGDTSGIDGDVVSTLAGAIVRSGLSGALFFMLGLAVTVLVNSSVGSIVGFLIYVFVLETGLIAVFLPQVSAWLPVSNAGSFTSGADLIQNPSVFDGFEGPGSIHHGYLLSGVIVFGWATIMGTVAFIRFRRRDID